jgi:hypothetical protein
MIAAVFACISATMMLSDAASIAGPTRPERRDGGHPHAHVREWAKLRKKLKDNLRTRSRIAHHPAGSRKVVVEIIPSGQPPKQQSSPDTVHLSVAHAIEEFSRLEIYMSEAERLRGKGETLEQLYTGAIRSHSITVTNLADELMQFFQNVFLKHVKNEGPASGENFGKRKCR